MISSHKLLTFTILLNIMLGIFTVFYHGSTIISFLDVNTEIEIFQGYVDDFSDNEKNEVKSDSSRLTEPTWGSYVRWSIIVGEMFLDSLNPLSITPGMAQDDFEEQVIYGLILLRTMILVLSVLETWLILKNKKTS